MAIPTFNSVGFCANYSEQGDWAFKFALQLSQNSGMQLNVFHFLSDPYNPNDEKIANLAPADLEKLAIEKEKELRLYYDDLAGEYLKVGFRVCYDKSWTELHRCLIIREFQVLVLAVPDINSKFSGKPIKEFADSFISPVILVGPERPDQFVLNSRAALLSDRLDLVNKTWEKISADMLVPEE